MHSAVACALALTSFVHAAPPKAAPAASPIAEARRQLDAGNLDDVLFALEGKTFTGAEKESAANLLATAGKKSLEKKDLVLALQFAQMALRQSPANVVALEVGARAAWAQEQFGPAEDYADRWMAATASTQKNDPAPRLLRAQLCIEAGDWQKALTLTDGIAADGLGASDKAVLDTVRARATTELKEREASTSEIKSLEAQLEAARAHAAQEPEVVPASDHRPTVVLYRTSWCGYCKKAAAFLTERKVDFVEKDIEADAAAAEELAQKAAAAGVHPRGVPVIDVKGTLVLGFDPKELERLLE